MSPDIPSPVQTECQVALITGAGRRIGAAIAQTLHRAGVRVILHYHRSGTEARELAVHLNRIRPDSARTLQANLLETAELEDLASSARSFWSRLDILVNNASSFYPTPLASLSEEAWEDLMGTNLKAPLFLIRATADDLRAQHGSIVNLVDIHAWKPLRDHLIYGAAKAGLEMLTRTLARELAPEVRVNAVAPGTILWQESGVPDSVQQKILARIPLKRMGSVDDIAKAVLFLVRDAPYVTGAVIPVDGGRSIGG
jgi:pteridine reductase